MTQLKRGLGLAALAVLVIPAAAQAKAPKPERECGSKFSTCASVSIEMKGRRASVDVANRRGRDFENRGRTDELKPWEYKPGFVPLGGPDGGNTNGGREPCASLGGEPMPIGECPASTVVTPEPVSMALLATGLAGMAGVGAVRRRIRRGSGPQ